MKVIIALLLLVVMMILGCSNSENVQETVEKKIVDKNSPYVDLIKECNSLCDSDETAYCEQEQMITLNGVDVKGTCRAFANEGNVEGFSECEGVCNYYDKIGMWCSVDGAVDANCDGITTK